MGAMFIGQQFLQNVLGYSTVDAGLAILPGRRCMVVVAPRSAKLVEKNGARQTLLSGYVFVLLGFLTMLLLWKEGISYWKVALGYAFVGIGVGLAGTPASHSLTGSVPVKRVGHGVRHRRPPARPRRRDHAVDLRRAPHRRLRGGRRRRDRRPRQARHRADVQSELTKSFSSAADTAAQLPAAIQDNIIAGAKTAFLQGDQWAYLAGIVAVLLGAALVLFKFPKHDDEQRLLASTRPRTAGLPCRREPLQSGRCSRDLGSSSRRRHRLFTAVRIRLCRLADL